MGCSSARWRMSTPAMLLRAGRRCLRTRNQFGGSAVVPGVQTVTAAATGTAATCRGSPHRTAPDGWMDDLGSGADPAGATRTRRADDCSNVTTVRCPNCRREPRDVGPGARAWGDAIRSRRDTAECEASDSSGRRRSGAGGAAAPGPPHRSCGPARPARRGLTAARRGGPRSARRHRCSDRGAPGPQSRRRGADHRAAPRIRGSRRYDHLGHRAPELRAQAVHRRAGLFDELRRAGGLSGTPNRTESSCDLVENSHASTALSYADGLAKALALQGRADHAVVAVVGDGALTGGMCWRR